MSKKSKYHFFFVGLTGIILWCTSCVKMDIPKETERASPKLFSDAVSIPSDFKWSSVKTLDFKVTVDDKFSGKYFYRVELYDNDPKLGTKANLLGAGMAKKGQDFAGKIVIPTLLQYVYLKQISPVGIPSVTMLKITDVTSLIVTPNSLRESSMIAESQVFSASRLSTTESVIVPSDALQITGGATVVVESGKSYVIKSGITFTGQINANNGTSGVKIYVEGTWTNRSYTMNLGNNNALYTTTSGKIDLNNVVQNTEGAFLNYGTTSLVDLSTSNTALYVNYGTLTAEKANFSNGSFTNFGTVSFQSLTSTTASTKIRNEGNLTATTVSLTNATLEAACLTKVGTLTTNSAIINVTDKAMLSIGNTDGGGTRFNIASGGILEVTGTAKFNSNRNYMSGPSSGKALARLKKVDVQNQWQAITYSGNLEIACSDHTPNEQWSTYYIIESPATIVPYDKSTVVISGTTCNAGGNNDKGAGTTPVDQTVTEINLGTYSYAFEDNWPDLGDYDMNDIVVDMNIIKFQNTSNKITKVTLNGKLQAVGASKRNAVAVQLDGIAPGDVKSVTYSRTNLVGTNLKLGSNGVETGQTYAVVTIVDDAHKAFGVSDTPIISTQGGSYTPVDIVITIEFATPLDNFTFQTLNMFIINSISNSTGRSEVHLVGYAGTDKIDKYLIDNMKGSRLSETDPFKSVNNEPWGLSVPVSFAYPQEAKNIKNVYPKFENWALSGGIKDTDWYLK
ncbi:LruC domain-containing protein [Emticicia sp. BO119]|uniref:LruC domain-containing protein n=1 Tax=Emticicia sp. BO119 TaxID=2757768 RepID=UPI0015F036C0|nr:LruC domain-containing protein [Emticicia sp. BO119]MBA4853242.1 LruC domain-containing protein [Emticicia sp. BO119]